MYKNQLQELAQRSCFNLPWYTCVREGPDHAPRFKAVVNFNGDTFESPNFCSTLRQAEHTAAEAALQSLSSRHSLATARILDETGVYKNLLQEIAQRVGSPLPQYTTFRSGSGHLPVFTGTVELAGITFTGEPAKNKKQAEKNAALAAWLSLKQLAQQDANSSSEQENSDEQEQIRIARALLNYRLKEQIESCRQNHIQIPFQQKFSVPSPRPSSPQRPGSKILPLFYQKTAPRSAHRPFITDNHAAISHPLPSSLPSSPDIRPTRPPSPDIRPTRPPSPDIRPTHTQRFPASTYIPIRHCRSPYQNNVQPVTLRTSVPVFSAPPRPPPTARPVQVMQAQPVRIAPPVHVRKTAPAFVTPPGLKGNQSSAPVVSTPSMKLLHEAEKSAFDEECDVDESIAVKCLEQLDI